MTIENLHPRHYWITGAGTGIGKELALQLAADGHKVIVSGRRLEPLQDLVAAYPNQITALQHDVTDEESIERIQAELESEYGYLDCVILNAGTCEYYDGQQPDHALVQRVFAANVFGVANCVSIALPLIRAAASKSSHGAGHIVGVSSMSTFVPMPRAEAYGASKAAMRYFLESLRTDLSDEKIDVTIVSPGFVKTPLTDLNDFDMPFLIDAQTAAERMIKGIEKRPRHISFPRRLGWTLSLFSILPGLWYNWVAPKMSRAKQTEAAPSEPTSSNVHSLDTTNNLKNGQA